MELTPEGPLFSPAPEHSAHIVLRRVATHSLNVTEEELRTERGKQYLAQAVAAFRDWVSENTGHHTTTIHITVVGDKPASIVRLYAYVLEGSTYVVPLPNDYRHETDAAIYALRSSSFFIQNRRSSPMRLELNTPFRDDDNAS